MQKSFVMSLPTEALLNVSLGQLFLSTLTREYVQMYIQYAVGTVFTYAGDVHTLVIHMSNPKYLISYYEAVASSRNLRMKLML
jgi:hypothetical protein